MVGGRPSKYKPEYAEQAMRLCELGATDADLARFFDIDQSTVYYWQSKFPEFSESLKTGKTEADNRVERSLYQRAVGYSHPDVHITAYEGDITETPIIKHYPPDVTAAIFWLKNRNPEVWRDKIQFEVNLRAALPAIAQEYGIDPAELEAEVKPTLKMLEGRVQ